MCGICGIVSPAPAPEARDNVAAMLERIQHRGPDGYGVAETRHGVFGHRRLAIVDVSGGAQPLYNEDGSVGIVFNGEIYNYRELRADLQAKGHIFRTQSDTEVIVHLFEEYGADAFAKLIGMFAFAVWNQDEVFLVRDQVGIKPLYIYRDNGTIAFSSELKALLTLPEADFSFSATGIRHYLTFRYCAADQTIFNRIRKLPSAHYVHIAGMQVREIRYYSLADDVAEVPEKEREEALTATIREVVGSQLMGEVPIGVTLSGGVDSSAISYFIHDLGASLESFSIGFPSVNEFRYSEQVARSFGLNHTMAMMHPQELSSYLPKYINAIDEPLADAACLPLYKLCETIKEHVTVVLSGEGGDEIFGGYPQYWLTCGAHNSANDAAFRCFLERSWYFLDIDRLLKTRDHHPLPGREYFTGSLLQAMTNYDLHTWVPENLMMKADKILMAHSLEGRFPFLDLRVMRLAAGLPDEAKLGPDGQSKWILKHIMRNTLPKDVLYRPKMGFSVPIREVLLQNFSHVRDLFNTVDSLDALIDRKTVLDMAEEYPSMQNSNDLFLWTLFVLYSWTHKTFS